VFGAALSIVIEVTNRDRTVVSHLRDRDTGRGECKGEVVSLHNMKMYGECKCSSMYSSWILSFLTICCPWFGTHFYMSS
jgi:hypothetical protein